MEKDKFQGSVLLTKPKLVTWKTCTFAVLRLFFNITGPTMVYVQTFLGDILNMFLRSACFIDESFLLVKSETSGLGTGLKCQIIRISNL
jgi:hypothetical protein